MLLLFKWKGKVITVKNSKMLKVLAVLLIVLIPVCFSLIGATAYSTAVMGDLNSDGRLSIGDATDIQKYLVNLKMFDENQQKLADVDGDGRITISDATRIMHILSGLSDMPTVPPQPTTKDPDIVDLPFIPAK